MILWAKILSFVVVSLFLLWIVYRIRNRKLFRMIAGMNDLGGLPLIGLAHYFIGKSAKEYFKIVFDALLDEHWSPMQIWICSKLCIGIENLEDVQKVLTSPDCYEKGSSYDQAPIANGLITSKPALWLEHRKLLGPTFHLKLLKGYAKDFNLISHKISLDLKTYCGKGGFNMSEMIGNHVIDVQLRTLFGSVVSPDVISRLHNNIVKTTGYLGELGLQLNLHPILSVLHRACFLILDNYYISMLNDNFEIVKKLVAQAQWELTKSDYPEFFLKRLVTLYKQGIFGETDFVDHVNTMLLAGGDTMITTFNNIFMLLAMNPAVQEKCYDELIANLGANFQEIDVDQLHRFDYLNRTIKECLRLIPTVPLIQRVSTVDIQIAGGTIPKGIDIAIPIFKILRDRQYWGDQPTRFDPDHFLEENISKRPALSYIPYSYGNRNCIGSKYAHLLTRFVVAHLIAKFKFSTKLKFEELKFVYGITMSIEPDQLIEVESR